MEKKEKPPLYRRPWVLAVGAAALVASVAYTRGYSDNADNDGFSTHIKQYGSRFEFSMVEPVYTKPGEPEPLVMLAGSFACEQGDPLAHNVVVTGSPAMYSDSLTALHERPLWLCNPNGGLDAHAQRTLTEQVALAGGLRK
jgi:hypothetical protein